LDTGNNKTILQRLLAIMAQGGGQTSQGIAGQLGISPRLVETMLQDLERRGFLKQESTCQDACGACDQARACSAGTAQRQRLWTARARPG
jgi:predicted ArsR family transcriptional regulator